MQYNYAVLWLTSQDDNAILIAIGELEGGIVHTPLSGIVHNGYATFT